MERSVKQLIEERERRCEENLGKYIEQLQHENTPYRLRAAEALGNCADARAVEPLIVALNDRENEVRWVAAQALGRLRDAQAVEPLLPLLADGKRDVRAAAADALGKLHDLRAVPVLSAALEDEEEPEVRTAIRRALREITGEASL